MKYRKKPVVVDAIRTYPAMTIDELNEAFGTSDLPFTYREGLIFIATLEGEMRVTWGDWIIRGLRGEYYPCKPDVFADVYEEVK